MPTNILKSIEDEAAKEVIKYRHKMMMQVDTGLDKINDIEFPEMKEKFSQAEDEFNTAMEDRLNQELSEGAQHLTEVKNDISSLGTDLGLLQESTAKLAMRTALIAPSIVSGPFIAPQQLPALKEELTQEVEELSALSTRCKNKISKLQLDKISSAVSISTFSLRSDSPLSSVLSVSDEVTAQAEQTMSEATQELNNLELPESGGESTYDVLKVKIDEFRTDNPT